MIPLQSTGGDSTILIELFLFLITCCSGYIAWRAREIWTRFDKLTEQVNFNSKLLTGVEDTGWDGLQDDVKANKNKIQENRGILNRVRRALVREDILTDESYNEDAFYRGGSDDDTIPDGGPVWPEGHDPREGD